MGKRSLTDVVVKSEKDLLYQAVENHPMSVNMAKECLDVFGQYLAIGIPKDELIRALREPYLKRLKNDIG